MARLLSRARPWVAVGLGALLGSGVGAVTLLSKPFHSAEMDYLITALPTSQSVSDLGNRAWLSSNRSDTYAQVITSRQVLQPVIDELGLDATVDTLAKTIDVSIPYDTSILSVEVVNPDEDLARDISTAIARRAPAVLVEFDRGDPEAPAQMDVLPLADEPRLTSSARWKRWAGPLTGGLVGSAVALTMTARQREERDAASLPDDVHAALAGLPVLGSLTIGAASTRPAPEVSARLTEQLSGVSSQVVAIVGATGQVAADATESAWKQLSGWPAHQELLIDLRDLDLRGHGPSAQVPQRADAQTRVWITGGSLPWSAEASSLLKHAHAVLLLIPGRGAMISDLVAAFNLVAQAGTPVLGAVLVYDDEVVD